MLSHHRSVILSKKMLTHRSILLVKGQIFLRQQANRASYRKVLKLWNEFVSGLNLNLNVKTTFFTRRGLKLKQLNSFFCLSLIEVVSRIGHNTAKRYNNIVLLRSNLAY